MKPVCQVEDQMDQDCCAEDLRKKFEKSEKRLPFHILLKDPWAVLMPQLNEETISSLLSLCSFLQLQPDKMYMTVIENLMKLVLFLSGLQCNPQNWQFSKTKKACSVKSRKGNPKEGNKTLQGSIRGNQKILVQNSRFGACCFNSKISCWTIWMLWRPHFGTQSLSSLFRKMASFRFRYGTFYLFFFCT